jgi:hypothetical protein
MSPALLHSDALASIPRAITALVFQERSLQSARKFVQSFFLSRQVDLRSMIKFRDPKRALIETVAKFGHERPKSRCASSIQSPCITEAEKRLSYRLLKETGRYSNSPMFVVGIFSGPDKLGEGFGSSLKMAEYRVCTFHACVFIIVLPCVCYRQPKTRYIGYTSLELQTTFSKFPRRHSLSNKAISTRPERRRHILPECSARQRSFMRARDAAILSLRSDTH